MQSQLLPSSSRFPFPSLVLSLSVTRSWSTVFVVFSLYFMLLIRKLFRVGFTRLASPSFVYLLHFVAHHLSMNFVFAILKLVFGCNAVRWGDVQPILHRLLISLCDLPQAQQNVAPLIDLIGQMSPLSLHSLHTPYSISLSLHLSALPQCNCNYAEFIRPPKGRKPTT